jgi:hypothetical protein
MKRVCIECDEEFDSSSFQKRKAGGLIDHCPDCSTEKVPKALGFASGDGKMASISILKFKSENDARAMKEYWARASGLRKGKSCQLHQPSLTAPMVSFKTVLQSQSANHKGKL